jgi:hypothetical protein
LEMDSFKLIPGLALDHDPVNLNLPSS